jgi:hypothetical protein
MSLRTNVLEELEVLSRTSAHPFLVTAGRHPLLGNVVGVQAIDETISVACELPIARVIGNGREWVFAALGACGD